MSEKAMKPRIVRANAGFELLHFIDRGLGANPDEYDILADTYRFPIIAWMVSFDGTEEPIPIAAGHSFRSDDPLGFMTDRDHYCVMHPSGYVASLAGDHYKTVDGWLCEVRKVWKRRLAKERNIGDPKSSAPRAVSS
jgi:hypothetical protein